MIVASITPYGRTGPYKNYRAQELNICHASGQGYLLPLPAIDPDRPPVKTGGHMADYDAGLVAVLPVLAAVFWKGTTGEVFRGLLGISADEIRQLEQQQAIY